MSVYNSSFLEPFEYVTFDVKSEERVILYTRDILSFLGSLLGKQIRIPYGEGVMVGVRGVDGPAFDYTGARAEVIVRTGNNDVTTRFIHWQNIFAYNWHLYVPTGSKTTIAASSERAIDLRGLMNG